MDIVDRQVEEEGLSLLLLEPSLDIGHIPGDGGGLLPRLGLIEAHVSLEALVQPPLGHMVDPAGERGRRIAVLGQLLGKRHLELEAGVSGARWCNGRALRG